jgi:hypothetical protein
VKTIINTYLTGFLLAGATIFSLTGCKEDTIINSDIVPVGDTINFNSIDTVTILSKSFYVDSLVTSLSISGIPTIHALGSSHTDFLYSGKTDAGIYLQVVPPNTGFKFAKEPDSAVLILPYAGFTWGDTNSVQTVTAYEITEPLSKDSTYYEFTTKTHSLSSLNHPLSAPVTLNKSIKDSVVIYNGEKRAPHLRIKLSQAFIDNIKTGATADSFTTFPAFLSYFNGIYLQAQTGGGALYYFRLDGSSDYSRASVMFYYQDDSSKTQTYNFNYNSSYCSHFNEIQKDYLGSNVNFNTAGATDDVFYIQNSPGSGGDLRFPFVKYLPKAPINKAELVITQAITTNSTVYTPPERLYPLGVDSTGQTYNILDRYPLSSQETLEFLDGRRKTVTINGTDYNQYTINIPRELQKAIVEGRDTLHLRISGASGFPGAYRLGAAGQTNANNDIKVKLRIIYSKI